MRIIPVSGSICSNIQNRTSFKSMFIDEQAQKLIDNLPDEREQRRVEEIKESCANTRYWDAIVTKLPHDNTLWCDFVEKRNPANCHQLEVRPFKVDGNKVKVVSTIDQDEDKTETLEFSSPERAMAVKGMYERNLRDKSSQSGILKELNWWGEQLKFLDEAYRYMKDGEEYSPKN